MEKPSEEPSWQAHRLNYHSKRTREFHETRLTDSIRLFKRIHEYFRRPVHAITNNIRKCITIAAIIVLLAGTAFKKVNADTEEPNNPHLNPTSTDINQGLVCHFNFDSTLNHTITDLSENGLHGTVIGASPSEGIINGGLFFNGQDNYVNIQNSAVSGFEYSSFGNLKEGTISLWFKLYSFPGVYSVYPVFYFGDSQVNSPTYSDHSSLLLEIGHSITKNRKLFYTISKNGSVYYCFNSIEDLELHQWYHFVTVVDKEKDDEGTQETYLNGETMPYLYNYGKQTQPYFFDYVPSKKVCWIGRGFFSYQPDLVYLHGEVDELRIYDRPLNEGEVKQLYDRRYHCDDSDMNGDRQVNSKDFAILADHWLTNDSKADINYDGVVDFWDLFKLSSNWLYSCPVCD